MAAGVVLLLALTIFTANAVPDSAYNQYDRNGPSTSGTDFIIAFLPNIPVDPALSTHTLQLIVTTDEPEPVTFTVSLNENLPAEMREGFPLTTTVSYGEVKVIDMHEDMAPRTTSAGDNGIERSKAIRLRTEGGKRVTVQGFNDDFRTSDGFIAIPCDGMRNSNFNRYEYIVFSGVQLVSDASRQRRSVFLIVPCEDDTNIRIEPTQTITLTGLLDLSSPPPTQILQNSLGSFAANAGQTLLIGHRDDLSGTVLRVSKPIALFSGHECANVPVENTACDYIAEQMPPGLAFGSTFFVVPFAARASGDQIRVGTLTDGTQVTVTCVTAPGDTPQTLEPIESDSTINRGEILTYMTPNNAANARDYKPSYCCIDSTEPVLVAQYGTGYTTDSSLLGKTVTSEAGDPFMSIIPPVAQYKNNFTMTSVEGAAGNFPNRFVNLAISAEFFDDSANTIEQIRVNNAAVSPIDGFIPFYCSNNEVCGYGAQVEVDEGILNIYHQSPDYGLLVSYYAYQQQNSYGLPHGFELTPISATRAILQDIIVPEDIGTITISVPRLGDLNQRSRGTLTYRLTSPEQAMVGEDFDAFGPVMLDYPGGNRRVALFEFEVTIRDDDVAEPTERFEIHGVGTQNLLFPIPFMTVTIVDNDGAPSVFFDPTSYTVNENDGTATITVRTDTPGGPEDGAVQFYTEDGSATAPGDYTATSLSGAVPVNFGFGQSSTTITVPIRNDNTVEPDEMFFGRLRSTGVGDVILLQDRAEVTIVNDDVETSTVSISPLTYEVLESEGTVNVVVTKTGNFMRQIQGTLTTSTGSAGVLDYSDGAFKFVIEPEEQQVVVSIPITDDVTVEQLREQFSVDISLEPQSGLSLGNSQGVVTIIDDDVEIGFNPVQYQVNEGVGLVTFELENRNPERDGQYTVQFNTVPGSAIETTNGENGDYVGTTQVVTFSPGTQRQTVQVTLVNDNIFESTEDFSAQLTTTDRRVSITEPAAVATIVDDDTEVAVSVSPLGYEVDESAGVVRVTVQKSGAFPSPISGTLTTTSGTAGPSDFAGGTYTYTIQPNQQETTVSIPILNDNTVEQLREQFSIRLSVLPQPGLNLGNSETSVTIVDDDGIVISLEPSTQTVTEGSDATFRIVTEGDSALPYSVQFQTVDGTARAPGDYSSASLTLTQQQLQGGVFEVIIPVRDDDIVEGRERLRVRLELTSQSEDLGVVSLGQSEGEVTIIDSDVVDIGFAPSVYSVNEDDGSAIFFIQNRNPDIERDVVVEFITTEGTALDGDDYIGTQRRVTFQPGQSLQTVQVMLIDDNVYEGLQEFFAELITTDSGVNLFQPDATARIIDEDEITIQFNPITYTVTESGSVEVIIQRIGSAGEPVTVNLSTQSGTATNMDFTQIINMPVTFGPSEFERRVTIQTNPDSLVEGREDFTAELVPVSDRVVITEDSAVINIVETQNVIVEFEPNSYMVNEDQGLVSFVLVKRTPTTQDVTVQITTMDGSATSDSDYSPLIREEVTFGPSEIAKIVMVPIQEDNVFEGEESFTAVLSLVPGSTGIEIGQQNTAIATITDDLIISFTSPDYSTPESSGVVEVCLTTSSVLSEQLSVVLLAQQSLPVDARDGLDFLGGEYRVQIPAGVREHCTSIQTLDDSIAFEGDEVFDIRFDISQLPDGVRLGPRNISTVRIIDDDEVSVFFDEESYQVTETDGSVSVCVRREGDAVESFSVTVATSENNPVQAEVNTDYRPVVTTLTFSPNDDRQCFDVPILIDQLDEGKEDFIVELTSVPDGVVTSQPEVATVSILDANVVTVNFVSPDYTVPENEGRVTVCLTTNIGSDQPLNVIASTAPKTATAGVDYSGSSRIVTIPPSAGSEQTCFDIEINDDNDVENDEEFLVNFQISSGSDAQIGAVGSTCVRIIDDDEETRVFFDREIYLVDEDAGSVTLCVRREGEASDSLPIQVTTSNLSPVDARDGSDYTGTIRTVTFGPNQNRECFSVPILNDQLDEGTELFSAEISSVPSDRGVIITNPDSTTISILDDDVTINFGSPTYTIPENGGSIPVCLTTNGGNDEPLPVTVSAAPRTATAGADYRFSTQVVTIPSSSSASEFCFDIDISDDDTVETNEEFVVTFQVPPGTDAEAGPTSTTIVTIVDDDVVFVNFGSPTYTIPEDGGPVEVCLTTNVGSNEPVTLLVSTAPTTATPGQDYDSRSQQVTIPPSVGPSETCFEVPIIDDSDVESNEEFLINFQIPPGTSAQPGITSSTTVTITDNDQVAVVEFVEPTYTVVEDEGSVEVCLRISGTITMPGVVQLFASPQTAEAGLDYVPGIANIVNFQPSGDSVVCTTFEIIDDLLALEDEERFIIDVTVVEGPLEIGDTSRTIVSIEDEDVLTIQPSTENKIVVESDGRVQVCLMKDLDTAQSFQVDVVVRETAPADNSATAGSDFMASTSTITFGALDRESCTEVEIINDDVSNEVPEVFQVDFQVLQQDNQGMDIISPSSTVTIIDDDVETKLVNDTVVADPLFMAPVMGGARFCYEIHGKPDAILNLVSDKCTVVNAKYESMNIPDNGNIIGSVGVRTADSDGNCHNIEVRLTEPGASTPLEVLVDGVEVSGVVQRDAVRVRRYSNRVRIAVPNCELIDLVMWVMHMEMDGQDMLKFVIMRGCNLAPTSHGLVGQFWNIPVTVTKYDGPLRPEYEPFFDRDILYLITVTPITERGEMRTFLGELHQLTWDRKSGPCYYAGSAQGGRTAEREENDSVIEGRYTDYQVNGLFDDNFIYSQFENDRCIEAV